MPLLVVPRLLELNPYMPCPLVFLYATPMCHAPCIQGSEALLMNRVSHLLNVSLANTLSLNNKEVRS